MDKYIGVKLIEAEPATRYSGKDFKDFIYTDNADMTSDIYNHINTATKKEPGYRIKYPDGYISWSPKNVFELAYMKIVPNPHLKTDVSISQGMVDDFIKEVHSSTIGNKTTLVQAILKNGFEIIEASACVDPDNYSEEIGTDVCLKKIKDKVWSYLGFLLQTGVGGVK